MTSEPTAHRGEQARVLLLPPTSRDAEAMRSLLSSAGVACAVCGDMRALCGILQYGGVGAVVVSEESLTADPDGLEACVREQPVWSDLPVIVLSRAGAESPKLAQVLSRVGNVSVLERPVRVTTLLSVVRSALRARERQYQVRDDLAERERAEARVAELLTAEQRARAEAERAGRMKDEFLATLSHELRTPLNAILGWSQILRGGGGGGAPDAKDLAEGLEVIERNARVQTQIIEDLLDMSRIISGRVRLEVRRIDLAEVVRAAVETVRPAADAKGIRVRTVLDSVGGPVSGDPNRLQQVFWNLVSNAVKFTPRNGQVQVVLQRVESQVEVGVSDTGEGIAADFLPHVFDRFRQADGSTTRRHGGLGLGLAIVKQLVELHGGSVVARSGGPGRGATFTVSLPVTVLHAEADGERALRRHPTAGGAAMPLDECVRITGVRVLVVDDEPDARALLQRVLEDCGAVIDTASSAAEAMERVRAARPDVLVSDIGMPGEDGYALVRRLRALEAAEGGNTPAIALTAYARPEDRVKALLAGFQHHVTKPVEPAELVTLIASLAAATEPGRRGSESVGR